ncbi:hypothetical protein FCV25MIE_16532, partial [Fagus crenata]
GGAPQSPGDHRDGGPYPLFPLLSQDPIRVLAIQPTHEAQTNLMKLRPDYTPDLETLFRWSVSSRKSLLPP